MAGLQKKAEQTIDEPITLAKAKEHLRVLHDSEDALIQSRLIASRKHAEGFIHKSIALTEFELFLDGFPNRIKLLAPCKSVESIKYLDQDNAEQTLSTDYYQVDNKSDTEALIVLKPGKSWPSTSDLLNSVQVNFIAGYDEIPEDIEAAILLMLGDMFENRENTIVGSITADLPNGYRELLWPHRVDLFGS